MILIWRTCWTIDLGLIGWWCWSRWWTFNTMCDDADDALTHHNISDSTIQTNNATRSTIIMKDTLPLQAQTNISENVCSNIWFVWLVQILVSWETWDSRECVWWCLNYFIISLSAPHSTSQEVQTIISSYHTGSMFSGWSRNNWSTCFVWNCLWLLWRQSAV